MQMNYFPLNKVIRCPHFRNVSACAAMQLLTICMGQLKRTFSSKHDICICGYLFTLTRQYAKLLGGIIRGTGGDACSLKKDHGEKTCYWYQRKPISARQENSRFVLKVWGGGGENSERERRQFKTFKHNPHHICAVCSKAVTANSQMQLAQNGDTLNHISAHEPHCGRVLLVNSRYQARLEKCS